MTNLLKSYSDSVYGSGQLPTPDMDTPLDWDSQVFNENEDLMMSINKPEAIIIDQFEAMIDFDEKQMQKSVKKGFINAKDYLAKYGVTDEANFDIECPICLEPLYKPVTTPCKHTFCYDCLVMCLERKR